MDLSIIVRTVTVYVLMVLGIRLFGKREIAQLTITDLVFILLISNAVQSAMIGQDFSLIGGLVAAATLFAINYIFGLLFFKSKTLTGLLQGHPLMLIYNGKVIRDNMNKAQISDEELEAVVREHGVENIVDVNLAILEIDGNVSVLSDNFKNRTVRKRRAHKILAKTE